MSGSAEANSNLDKKRGKKENVDETVNQEELNKDNTS